MNIFARITIDETGEILYQYFVHYYFCVFYSDGILSLYIKIILIFQLIVDFENNYWYTYKNDNYIAIFITIF